MEFTVIVRAAKQDILCAYRIGHARTILRCFRSPCLCAVLTYRFGSWLICQSRPIRLVLAPWYWWLNYRSKTRWGIEIPPDTTIGPGLYIGHFGGITISDRAVIGSNVQISQGVTIGVAGQGENRGVPVIGDDVYIGAGAKVIGKIHVGNNVKIGANAVVYEDIPDNAVVAAPGYQILSFKGNRRPEATPRQ